MLNPNAIEWVPPNVSDTCEGVNSSGYKCVKKKIPGNDGFCDDHREPFRCLSRQCKKVDGLGADGRCIIHRTPRWPTDRRCKRCNMGCKPNYDYCSFRHSPHSGDMQSSAKLRTKTSATCKYSPRIIDNSFPIVVEIDHIVDVNCFRYIIHQISPWYNRQLVASTIDNLNEVCHMSDNIALTQKCFNRAKSSAIYNMIDDMLTGHRMPQGDYSVFYEYMIREQRDGYTPTHEIVIWISELICSVIDIQMIKLKEINRVVFSAIEKDLVCLRWLFAIG